MFFSRLYMALRHFCYNFALKDVFFINLGYSWSLVGRNTDNIEGKKDVKIDKSTRVSILLIKNPAV